MQESSTSMTFLPSNNTLSMEFEQGFAGQNVIEELDASTKVLLGSVNPD